MVFFQGLVNKLPVVARHGFLSLRLNAIINPCPREGAAYNKGQGLLILYIYKCINCGVGKGRI
jgi:hypothetical protein